MKIPRPFALLRTFAGSPSPRFLSLHTRHRLRPSSPKVEFVAIGPRGPMASGRICFAPSRAKQSSVSPVLDTPAADTNLKCDTSKTEDSLCNRIQLEGVNLPLVAIWENSPLRRQPRI